MTYLKENWRKIFIVITTIALAIIVLKLKQPVLYNFFSFAVLTIAAIFTLLSPRYAQYCYFTLSLVWFIGLIGLYFSHVISASYFNPYHGGVALAAISMVLPIGLAQIFMVLFLGVAGRVWYDRAIEGKRTKAFLKFTIALAVACFGLVCYLFSGSLRPSIHWIVELHYSWSKSLPLILLDFTFWFFLFAALPYCFASSFVKNWSQRQALVASIFTSVLVLFSNDRVVSFLDLESNVGNLGLGKFFISITMFLSTYYISKYIQHRFINTKYLVGFD